MSAQASRSPGPAEGRSPGDRLYKRDFWATENARFTTPHFRMRKVARIAGRIARGQERCDLLDVGCGPTGTLATLLPRNVRYHGIDIAIQQPAVNLVEADILASPITFHDQKFDVIVAQGVFEYLGQFQSQKLAEIADLLKDDGKFIVTYQNFDHRKKEIYWPFSNVQPPAEFRADLSRHFRVERVFAGS